MTHGRRRSPVSGHDEELGTAGVWWLPYGAALAGSCEAIVEAADATLARATTVDHALSATALDGVRRLLGVLALPLGGRVEQQATTP